MNVLKVLFPVWQHYKELMSRKQAGYTGLSILFSIDCNIAYAVGPVRSAWFPLSHIDRPREIEVCVAVVKIC